MSCVVPDGARPTANIDLDVATQNNRRGVVLNERLVALPSVAVALPAKQDGTLIARTWGAMDLSNSNGDAWVPDGDRFGFSELDWSLLYEQVLGDWLLTTGFITYNLPKGGMLPQSAATSEFMVEGSTRLSDDWWGIEPRAALHYDYDAIEGVYLRAGVAKRVALSDELALDFDVHLGWMDSDQAYYTYGAMMPSYASSGFADVRLTGRADYRIDDHMSFHCYLCLSDVVDSDFRDSLDAVGIESSQVWLGVGMTWSY